MTGGETVSLKEHFESRIQALEKIGDERFKAAQEAIRVADERMREYKESANQLRATFVNRTEHEALQTIVTNLTTKQGESKGRQEGISQTWATVLTVMGLLGGAGLMKLFT